MIAKNAKSDGNEVRKGKNKKEIIFLFKFQLSFFALNSLREAISMAFQRKGKKVKLGEKELCKC